MINEGRKENIFNKYQNQIEAERKLVSGYLPDGLSSLYDYLIVDPFIEQTNFKYLDDLLAQHYSDWRTNVDEVNPLDRNSARNYLEQVRDRFDRVVEALKFFDVNNRKYNHSEFSKYRKNDFFDFLQETDKLKTELETKKGKKEVEKIYEDDRLLIVKPKTYEASCLYGAGTKWCVSSKNTTEHWENYTDVGTLYFLITKGVPASNKFYKVALFINWEGVEEWWDATDEKLDGRNIELLESAYGPGIEAIKEHYNKLMNTNSADYFGCVFSSRRKTSRVIKIAGVEVLYLFEFRDAKPGEVLFDLEVAISKGNKTNKMGSYILHIDAKQVTPVASFQTLVMVTPSLNMDLLGWDELGPFPTQVTTLNVSCEDVFIRYFNEMTSYLTRLLLKSPTALSLITDENTILATGYSGNYKFTNRNQGLIKKLIDWLQSGKKGTRMDFLVDAGYAQKRGNVYYSTSTNSPIEARGFFSTFFASATNAGIIKNTRQGRRVLMGKGPNFGKFVKGAKIVYV